MYLFIEKAFSKNNYVFLVPKIMSFYIAYNIHLNFDLIFIKVFLQLDLFNCKDFVFLSTSSFFVILNFYKFFSVLY